MNQVILAGLFDYFFEEPAYVRQLRSAFMQRMAEISESSMNHEDRSYHLLVLAKSCFNRRIFNLPCSEIIRQMKQIKPKQENPNASDRAQQLFYYMFERVPESLRALPNIGERAFLDPAIKVKVALKKEAIQKLINEMDATTRVSISAVESFNLSNMKNTLFRNQTLPSSLLTRMQRVEDEGRCLLERVNEALSDGGKLEPLQSWQEMFCIKDKWGTKLAVFKSEDRNWGPNHPDPDRRRCVPSEQDIAFGQLKSYDQGLFSQKQYLATLLDIGGQTSLPPGIIVEIESKHFPDPEDVFKGLAPKIQRKLGYLQAWVPNAKMLASFHPVGQKVLADNPNAIYLSEPAYSVEENPILGHISLDEFQKICIQDFLLYNEDGHLGNILVFPDEQGLLHLVPVDKDSVLPWRLLDLKGIFAHPRSQEPFTNESVKIIGELDPQFIEKVVKKMGLPRQSALNARMLALTLKKFSAAGLTLADLYQFGSRPNPFDPTSVSLIWQLMEETSLEAIDALPFEDQAMIMKEEYLTRSLWENRPIDAEDKQWLKRCKETHVTRILNAIDQVFWNQIERRLDETIQNIQRMKHGE